MWWNQAILIICASSSFFVHPTNSNTCENTSGAYTYSYITVTCANNTRLIPEFNKTVSDLQCLDCNVPILDDTTILISFRGNTFNMSNSHIRKIKAGAFNTFTNHTKNFIFENNEIGYLQPKIFNAFNAIEEISLRNCKISSLEAEAFNGTRLLTLDLSKNNLSNISSIFDGLKVMTLNLSNNAIKELPEDTFDKITFWQGRTWKYQELDLSRNFIEKLKPNTFKFPNQDNTIRRLFLGVNSIEVIEIQIFSQITDLQTLSLEKNKISEVHKDSFKGLTSLRDLILNNNLISNIPLGLFQDLENLRTLDLSLNRLSSLSPITFSGLTALAELNISHNDFKKFDNSHLVPLGKLVKLDITATKLHHLELKEIFEHHTKLEVLILNDNFWTCKDLVQIYKLMNMKAKGFNHPARHFDVPNLHGIACSRVELESYDNLSFEEFLNIISQDRVFEDIFDSRINQHQQVPDFNVESVIRSINIITCMFVTLSVIGIILLICCVFKRVGYCKFF